MSTSSNNVNIKSFIDEYKTSQTALITKKITRTSSPNIINVAGKILPATSDFKAIINDNSIVLSWTKINRAVTYKIEKSSDESFTHNVLTIYNNKANSYTDTGLQSGFTYFYRLSGQASNMTGDYAYVNATTLYSFGSSVLTVSNVGENGFDVAWTAVNNATGYKLESSSTQNFGSVTNLYTGSNISTHISALQPFTQYYLRVYGTAAGYNIKTFGLGNITTKPILLAPGSFVISNLATTSLTLTWAAVSHATGYVVQRSTTSDFSANLTTIYTGSLLTTNNTGLTASTHYYYRVHATATGSTTINYATVNGSTTS